MTRRTKTQELDPSTRGTRCIANRKNGQKCKRWAIRGGSVCASHGGRAPQVRRKAEERIREAADPAAAKLIELMSSKKVPHNIQLAAARDLLDRAGIGTKDNTVELVVRRFEQDIEGLFVDVVDGEIVEPAPLPPPASGGPS